MSFTKLTIFHVLLLFCLPSVLSAKKKKGELKVEVIQAAEDCSSGQAAVGDKVTAHYTGKLLTTGQVFDSSRGGDREPFAFRIGMGQVIKGFDQGFQGMCVGEQRRLTIPAHLAYGDRGSPPMIPGGATLVFEVELMSLEKGSVVSFASFSALGGVLLPAAVVVVVIYFVYQRAQEEKAKAKQGKTASSKKRR